MKEPTDEQLELGMVKLQLYDRMIHTLSQAMALFATILQNFEVDKRTMDLIESITDDTQDIFQTEHKLQDLMDQEILKETFGDDVLH